MEKRPQVLLLGNGINRAYQGESWQDVLRAISTRKDLDIDKLKSPMPLKVILVTDNHVDTAVKNHRKEFYGIPVQEEQKELTEALLNLDFEHILTTNYSYELEATATGRLPTDSGLVRMMGFNRVEGKTERAENKYMLHTFYKVDMENGQRKIWHIHGEARKPCSIIIGHYYYANLLTRMKAIADQRGNYGNLVRDGQLKIESWVDAFITGDVYVLGFGFDLSEIDLWWLVNRKQREKELEGRIYWFEPSIIPESGAIDEKRELLKSMGVVCEDLGFYAKDQSEMDYRAFYIAAVGRIEALMKEKKGSSTKRVGSLSSLR